MTVVAIRAKGEAIGWVRSVAGGGTGRIKMLLLSAVEGDVAVSKHATIDALLAASGNTEATATDYTRKTLTITLPSQATFNTAGAQYATFSDVTYTALGGATNNTIAAAVIYYDPTNGAADSACIPISVHTTTIQTNDSDVIVRCPTTGFVRAS